MISIEDFAKLELKVGTIISAGEVEGSEKLIKLLVDMGEASPRQIFSGIRQWYQPERLVGKQVVVLANLESKMIMGMESQGMILAADGPKGPCLLVPQRRLPPGVKVR